MGKKHNEVPVRVALVHMMFTFVEDFDKNMDKVIVVRMNKPCYRKQEPYCFLISVLCMDIAETFGYKMKLTDTMMRCIKVLVNCCYSVADAIIADEEAEANVLS